MVKLYRVGGAVRDMLLGVESKDIDYAVEASSFEEMLDWIRWRGEVFLVKPEFCTVRAKMTGGVAADFVLCRKDGHYSDGRHPDFVVPGTILDDLARRDFTINAMAIDDDTGEIIDPYEGRVDIKDRWLGCVGSPKERFSEDALRMLRALRFTVTRDLRLCPDIVESFGDPELLQKLIDNISAERKREELEKCFRHDTLKTLDLLGRFDRQCYHRLTKHLFGLFWLRPLVRT